MSLDLAQNSRPLTTIEELEEFFRRAERPPEQHQVGLEHEKLVYPTGSAVPPTYEGEHGIGALLRALEPFGYEAIREEETVIALRKGALTVSLEPGGQFELSGNPFPTAREAHRENVAHVNEVKRAASSLGLRLVGMGYRPFESPDSVPWMPKGRYRIMREVLPKRGAMGLRMMLMTATCQVSLD